MNREVYPLGPPRCTRLDHLPVPIRNPRTPFFSYSYLLLISNYKNRSNRPIGDLWAKLRSLRPMPSIRWVTVAGKSWLMMMISRGRHGGR